MNRENRGERNERITRELIKEIRDNTLESTREPRDLRDESAAQRQALLRLIDEWRSGGGGSAG